MTTHNPNVKISVILPTFNEKENIALLVDAILHVCTGYECEVIVVDDDSPDGTWRIVEEKAVGDTRIRCIHRVGERGLTSALNAGINAAKGDVVVWLDSDFQMPPAKIPELVQAVVDGNDVAVGSRFVPGGQDIRYNQSSGHGQIIAVHKSLSRIISVITSLVFRSNHKDWTSGFIAVNKQLFNETKLHGDYGEYFMYLVHYALNNNKKVIEIPYVLGARQDGDSKSSRSYLDMALKGVKYLYAVMHLSLFKRYK